MQDLKHLDVVKRKELKMAKILLTDNALINGQKYEKGTEISVSDSIRGRLVNDEKVATDVKAPKAKKEPKPKKEKKDK